MVPDIHPAATVGAVAIEDVELPRGEVGLRRPEMRHDVALPALLDSRRVKDQAGQEDTSENRPFLAPCFAVVNYRVDRGKFAAGVADLHLPVDAAPGAVDVG